MYLSGVAAALGPRYGVAQTVARGAGPQWRILMCRYGVARPRRDTPYPVGVWWGSVRLAQRVLGRREVLW